jgi:hypothetical protein
MAFYVAAEAISLARSGNYRSVAWMLEDSTAWFSKY